MSKLVLPCRAYGSGFHNCLNQHLSSAKPFQPENEMRHLHHDMNNGPKMLLYLGVGKGFQQNVAEICDNPSMAILMNDISNSTLRCGNFSKQSICVKRNRTGGCLFLFQLE